MRRISPIGLLSLPGKGCGQVERFTQMLHIGKVQASFLLLQDHTLKLHRMVLLTLTAFLVDWLTSGAKQVGAMPKYFFNLVDGTHSVIDPHGKELDSLYEAHLHALRMFEKLIQFIPDQLSPTCQIRITAGAGEPVLTVFLPALASEERFQRVVGAQASIHRGSRQIGLGSDQAGWAACQLRPPSLRPKPVVQGKSRVSA